MEICSVGGPAPTDLAVNTDGTAINPIALLRHLRGDPSIMSQLQQVEVFSLFFLYVRCTVWGHINEL